MSKTYTDFDPTLLQDSVPMYVVVGWKWDGKITLPKMYVFANEIVLSEQELIEKSIQYRDGDFKVYRVNKCALSDVQVQFCKCNDL
jgi:hypothetical protein